MYVFCSIKVMRYFDLKGGSGEAILSSGGGGRPKHAAIRIDHKKIKLTKEKTYKLPK